jgi:hypothetical protein
VTVVSQKRTLLHGVSLFASNLLNDLGVDNNLFKANPSLRPIECHLGFININKKKVKLSRYTPWRHMEEEEV